jgi:hypothetical protein
LKIKENPKRWSGVLSINVSQRFTTSSGDPEKRFERMKSSRFFGRRQGAGPVENF